MSRLSSSAPATIFEMMSSSVCGHVCFRGVQLELAFRKEFREAASTSVEQDLLLKVCKHILIWVEEQTYWIPLRFLMLGFEFELYSTHEYCIVLIKLAEKTHLKIMLSNDSMQRKSKKKKDFVKDVGKDYQVPPAVL